MWTPERLQEVVRTKVGDRMFVVVSNREPFVHRYEEEAVVWDRPTSGLVVALDPVMRSSGGIWVAHGSGPADRDVVDAADHVEVPPDDPKYTLRRVWLSKEEEDGYYYGCANEALWPLCHIAYTRPKFDEADWEMYRRVNEKFADAVAQEVGARAAFVFIQDYHFALLPRFLKERCPNVVTAHFWHIPWPNPEVFRIFPWKEELLQGLLCNDLLGFHILYHCQNFIETVDRTMECLIDREQSTVTAGGKTTLVKPFPISVDFADISRASSAPECETEMKRLRKQLGLKTEFIGLGVDRLDYTKGIPERLTAIDRFFEKYPAYRKRFTFLQIAVPSRSRIDSYKQIEQQVVELVEEINWKHGEGAWRPIVLERHNYPPHQLRALYRLSHVCVVTSLHDGMNLVAKEFVAARVDEDGVLVLSQFTGAARELADALLVNPFAVDRLADALAEALAMPEADRKKRMARLRDHEMFNNIYRWAGKALSTLFRFEFVET